MPEIIEMQNGASTTAASGVGTVEHTEGTEIDWNDHACTMHQNAPPYKRLISIM